MTRSLHSCKVFQAVLSFASMVASSSMVVSGILGSLLTTAAIAGDIGSATFASVPNADVSSNIVLTSGNLAQVNIDPVLALDDISPDHWGYTAVQRLVEDHGCLVGYFDVTFRGLVAYFDVTFRGDELLTRYEFAAAMNACLDRMIELIPLETDPGTSDVRVIQDLQRQLDCLTGDVERLEGNTAGESASDDAQCTGL